MPRMLILSTAKITIRGLGQVQVEGPWQRHEAAIRLFLSELGLTSGTIRLRFGRHRFSSAIPSELHQRLRNFLVNECPIPRS